MVPAANWEILYIKFPHDLALDLSGGLLMTLPQCLLQCDQLSSQICFSSANILWKEMTVHAHGVGKMRFVM